MDNKTTHCPMPFSGTPAGVTAPAETPAGVTAPAEAPAGVTAPAEAPAGVTAPGQPPAFNPNFAGGPRPAPPVKKKPPYTFSAADVIMGLFLLLMGMLFWEWDILFTGGHLGSFLFILITSVACLVYTRIKGNRQNPRSLLALGVVILGALPLLLYDTLPIHSILILALFAACLGWLMYTGKTQLSEKLSGYIVVDAITQICIVPFYNFGGIFSSWKWGVKNRKGGKAFIALIVGIIAFIPIFAIILSLLISADKSFEQMMNTLADLLGLETLVRYVFELIIGIPVACFIFGSLYGNTHKSGTDMIKKEPTDRLLTKCHIIPRPGACGPLAMLLVVYAAFFVALGNYQFAAFSGKLPEDFTYSEYARQGFFELCAVASINLAIVLAIWLFARRNNREYPRPLRIMTGLLCALTCLLILTALSKMVLYITEMGFSRLRLYTLWFMVLLLLVFFILVIWHIRPFNAGRPVVIGAVILILALFLTNTDGLITRYNLDLYEQGQAEELDGEMLGFLTEAAVPPLADFLKTNEGKMDTDQLEPVRQALRIHRDNYLVYHDDETKSYDYNLNFSAWNFTGKKAADLLQEMEKVGAFKENDAAQNPELSASGS